jgi:predicted transposase YbfD/YdcC
MDALVKAMIPRALHEIPDVRRNNARHRLIDLLVIAFFGILSGADDWVAVARYGREKHGWLKTFLELPHGIPSHDTFNSLFAALEPEPFEKCFMEWMSEMVNLSGGQLVAIDGKSLRRSYEHSWDKSGMAHIVSAFVSANRLVLGQLAVADKSEGKGGEQGAVERLLQILHLQGAIVTIDAMGCNGRIAELIRAAKGDYILQVKGNQEKLEEKVKATMDEAIALKFKKMPYDQWDSGCEGDHGRLERRRVYVLWDTSGLGELAAEWEGIACMIVVDCERTVFVGKDEAVKTVTRHYYISSLNRRYSARRIGECVRGHWAVENNLHWQLDVSFNEDQRRLRKKHGAENFSRLCRMALNLLKHEATAKCGIANKRKMCGWNNEYLLKVLACVS